MNDIISCDYLIIGGGAAGCIVAKRLAERTQGKVILLEAGRNDEADEAALYLDCLDQQDEHYDWGYVAKTVEYGGGFSIDYARAKMLGGCANHNDCAFLAPLAGDLERWRTAGADNWSARWMERCLQRLDKQIRVESSPVGTDLSQAFIDAAKRMGIAEKDFRQNPGSGTGWFPLNVEGRLRQSSSVCYLHPLNQLPENLQVITNCHVQSLVVDNNKVSAANTDLGRIRVRGETILSAGSVNTPQILMLSGIGPAQHLRDMDIDVVHDLTGVGANLMDHAAANITFELYQESPAWNLTPCESTLLMRLGQQCGDPDILFHFVLRLREKYVSGNSFKHVAHGVKIAPNVARPRSRGSVKLKSPQIGVAPEINLNYFSDPEDYDMRTMLGALRIAREIGNSDSLKPYFKREITPGLEVMSDRNLESYIRETCETVYHPAGTCKMGRAKDADSVVTPDLKVKGIDGLRIADASVFPDMVSVNICNTVMMIGEAAADLISGEYKLG